MKPIKTVLVSLMLAAALMLLSGCHVLRIGSDYMEVPAAYDATQPVELTFWAKNDTNKVQTAVYTRAIETFEELYPNVKINLKLFADYGRLFEDVIANTRTNTQPNICITYPDHIATYMSESHAVLQMDNWIRDSRYGLGGSELLFDSPKEAEMVPEFMQECVLEDHYYALPYMRSTEALYVNLDMVEQLGYELPEVVTWDFIWEVSEKALEKNADGTYKINGQTTMIPFIYKSTDNMMITMLKQLDAPYSTEDGKVLIFNDTTTELLKEIYPHAKNKAFSTFAISSYPGNFLNAGQCIFAIDSTAGATWMGSDAPLLDIHEEQIKPFRLALRPIPQFDPEHPQMISQGPSICIFAKQNPQEVLASWLFVQYLLTNEVQLGYAETEGYVPVTLKAQQSEAYQEYLSRKGEDNDEHYIVKIEASELLMNHTEDTFVTPVFNGSANLRNAAGLLIEEITKNARRGKELNDQLITDIYQKVSKEERLDEIEVKKKTEPGEHTDDEPEEEQPAEEEKQEDTGATGAASARDLTNQELPTASKALLISVPAVWAVIGGFSVRDILKNRKDKKKQGK